MKTPQLLRLFAELIQRVRGAIPPPPVWEDYCAARSFRRKRNYNVLLYHMLCFFYLFLDRFTLRVLYTKQFQFLSEHVITLLSYFDNNQTDKRLLSHSNHKYT